MDIVPIPSEIWLCILGFLDEVDLCKSCSSVSSLWYDLALVPSLWRRLYKSKWHTDDISLFDRTWKKTFEDRLTTERKFITKEKREEILQKEEVETKKAMGKTPVDQFALYRYNRFLGFGDFLRDKAETASDDEKLKLTLCAGEQYSTSLSLTPSNYVTLFNWGYLLHHFAKLLCSKKNPVGDSMYHLCFTKYNRAINMENNLIKEDTLSRWGDAIHDYAKTKKTRREVEDWLYLSYDKYEQALKSHPNYYIAYDYWGLTLYTHAKLKKNDEDEADRFYAEAVTKYRKAHELKPQDGYILCHWAATLQNQAAQKEGLISKQIFEESFIRFEESLSLLPDDAFTARSWGDALHDCGKKLIQEAEETDCTEAQKELLLEEARDLLEKATQKFQTALKLRPDYTNAMNNWGLCLSTLAKILPHEKSEELFKESYEKFSQALKMTESDESFIICNWAMTLVSQAKKRSQIPSDTTHSALLEEARGKLLAQVSKGDSWSLFCMARWCSVFSKPEECKEWLTRFQQVDNYLPRATKGQMAYFKNVQHYPWFREIVEKARAASNDLIDFS